MVCKEFEELCNKFRNLSPHMRIDIMCGMLRMCLPPELRFIGSVVEDLAKKDYYYLREQEIKANSQAEISKYRFSDDRTLRTGLALSLSLLHSWNTNSASEVFDLLKCSLKRAFEVTSATDRETVDVILLVLMMAMNHPAFSFHQRQFIASHYEIVERQLESLFSRTESVNVGVPTTSPVDSGQCTTCNSAVNTTIPHVQSTASQNKVHICNIEMKTEKVHRRHERRHEYKFQVKWSDGSSNDIVKTQSELREFHSRLVKLYPEEAGAHKQDRKIPFLGNANVGHKEEIEHISDYVSKLVKLPKHILECDHVVEFFNFAPSAPEAALHMKEESGSIPTSPVHVVPVSSGTDSVMMYQSSHSLTVYNSHFLHHGESVPLCEYPQAMENEPVLTTPQLSPNVNQRVPESYSPMHSPQLVNHLPPVDGSPIINQLPPDTMPVLTNHISPEEDSRSMSPDVVSSPEVGTLNVLLKKLYLNKQQENLEKFSIEQLSCMNLEELEKLGLSKEEAEKLQLEIEASLNREKSLINGLIEPVIPSATINPPLMPWPGPQPQCIALHYQDHHIPQPTAFPYQPHLPYVYPFPAAVGAPGLIRTRNSSPTGSDYSSPSPSPVPQKKSSQLKLSDCSSGEENEKERSSAVESPTVEGKNSYNSNYLIDNGRYTGINGKQFDDKKTLVQVPTAIPPPVYMTTGGTMDTSSIPVPVGCGYQSDPTPTGFAPRIPVIAARAPYKARPAHVSMNIPPKNMISMPPDTHPGKRCSPLIPIAYAPPIPRTEASTITSNVVTHVPGNPMFSMAPSDIGKRQYFYGIVQSPLTLNGNNGHRPVTCTVTTSTQMVMTTRQANSGSPLHQVASGNGVQGNGMVHSISENTSISSQSVLADNPSIHNSTPIVPNNNVSTVSAPVRTSVSPNNHVASVPAHSSCNNCNCNCHSAGVSSGTGGNSGGSGNGNRLSGINLQHQYPNIYPNHFAPGQIWHWPYMTPSSNGFIPHMYPPGFSYHIPPSQYQNGFNPELLNNHHNYIQHGLFPVPYSLLNRGPVYNNSNRSNGHGRKIRKNCYNCGSVDHIGADCTDKTLESVSGHFQLNYEPKSNSD